MTLPFSKRKQLGKRGIQERLRSGAFQTRTQMRRQLMGQIDDYWALQVKRRDHFTCQWCGARGYVESHHIVTKKRCGARPLRWDLNNGITLCRNCHGHGVPQCPEEWFVVRDRFLKRLGTSYEKLQALLVVQFPITTDNLTTYFTLMKESPCAPQKKGRTRQHKATEKQRSNNSSPRSAGSQKSATASGKSASGTASSSIASRTG